MSAHVRRPGADAPHPHRGLACDVLLGDSSPLDARLYSQGLISGTFGYSFDTLPGVAYAYIGGDSRTPHAVAGGGAAGGPAFGKGRHRPGLLRPELSVPTTAPPSRVLIPLGPLPSPWWRGSLMNTTPLLFPEMFDSITPRTCWPLGRTCAERAYGPVRCLSEKE